MQATSSSSASGVPGEAYTPFSAKRTYGRPSASPGWSATTAAQASSIVAPSATSSTTSRVPAISRWRANSRARTRIDPLPS